MSHGNAYSVACSAHTKMKRDKNVSMGHTSVNNFVDFKVKLTS